MMRIVQVSIDVAGHNALTKNVTSVQHDVNLKHSDHDI